MHNGTSDFEIPMPAGKRPLRIEVPGHYVITLYPASVNRPQGTINVAHIEPPAEPTELVGCVIDTFTTQREAAEAAAALPNYTFEAPVSMGLAPFERVYVSTIFGSKLATVVSLHPPRPDTPLRPVLQRYGTR